MTQSFITIEVDSGELLQHSIEAGAIARMLRIYEANLDVPDDRRRALDCMAQEARQIADWLDRFLPDE